MTRELTLDERAALEDIIQPDEDDMKTDAGSRPWAEVYGNAPPQGDVDAWWRNCQDKMDDPEAALAGKIARHKPAFDARKAAGNYRNKGERTKDIKARKDAIAAAGRAARPYDEKRKEAYGSWQSQEDMKVNDSLNGTTTWIDHILAVKAAHPKE